jgi:dihydropteroate synthase
MQPPDNPFLSGGPYIMGIVNATPDSFSDGGKYDPFDHAMKLAGQGAHILDIGGESTRPGAIPVSPQEEQDRILPVIEKLKAANCPAMISIDTRNASTMRHALSLGIEMVNDVSALRHDPDSIKTVASENCFICIMHMQGDPASMQKNPQYQNVVEDVFEFLSSRLSTCETAGIAKNRLIADSGIGFGKTRDHNLDLMKNLSRFASLNVPLLLGASRKSFIGGNNATDRLAGSIAAALHGLSQGVQIFRVHDVAETRQAFDIWNRLH